MPPIYLKTQFYTKVPSAFSLAIIATVNMISSGLPSMRFLK